jgi:hypothetical protein
MDSAASFLIEISQNVPIPSPKVIIFHFTNRILSGRKKASEIEGENILR